MTIGSSYVTMLDMAKEHNWDGAPAKIAEVLSKSNPIVRDAHVEEANLPPASTMHVIRTGLPTPTWRLLNYGVAQSKGTTQQVTDVCGMLENYSEVDKKLVDMFGGAWRAKQDLVFMEAHLQGIASAMFYASTNVNPEKFMGLSPRFNDPTLTTANGTPGTGDNMVDGGGTGSTNTSLWLIEWGSESCGLFFPKGGQGGFVTDDRGQQTNVDSNGLMHEVYRTNFRWDIGMFLSDWRKCVRICNIDVTTLTDDATSGADLVRKAIKAYYKRPTNSIGGNSNAIWYCNKTVAEFLDVQVTNKVSFQLTRSEVAGGPVLKLCGSEVHICDALTETEDAITGF